MQVLEKVHLVNIHENDMTIWQYTRKQKLNQKRNKKKTKNELINKLSQKHLMTILIILFMNTILNLKKTH